ncbi:CAP domain-containing protein [Aspergillus ambiguus]|uniref:putative extracellular SCP domain protein Pry1 n=1 Tax=Aspergillus ambiguus TaxID=176160 RepID=UPI003CCD3691
MLLALPVFLSTATIAQQTLNSTRTVAVTPTAPHPPSYTVPEIFQDTILLVSNNYRRDHNASHLVWNDRLTEYAQAWAHRCQWRHSYGPYGENLAFGYPNVSAAVEAWGDEEVLYNYRKPTGFSEETGHFTQLVWRATQEVGCAAVDCGYDTGRNATDSSGRYKRAQGWYVVCEYSPPGNMNGGIKAIGGGDLGLFRVNVQSASTYSGPYPTTTESGPTPTSTSGAGTVGVGRGELLGLGLWWRTTIE